MTIQLLMSVPKPARSLNWLRRALQDAIQLEFSTIPPYLCAMWSILDQGEPAYGIIESVVMQEMLHMGLACNMLVAIGGCPRIEDPDFVPEYPCELPGNVRPGLYIGLVGLYRELVRDVFMQIEYPEHGPVPIQPMMFAVRRTYSTIGEFYDAVSDAFSHLAPPISQDRQLASAKVHLKQLPDLDAVICAIKQVKEQGEGTVQSPFEDDFAGELAHYYRFMQIIVGKQIVRGQDGKAHWDDSQPIPFPDVYPMAMVPKGGYPLDVTRPFNQQFTAVLDRLQLAWQTGGTAGEQKLGEAYKAMHRLREPAIALMRQEIQPNSGRGNYGPDFRLL
jgi:Ferritin-like